MTFLQKIISNIWKLKPSKRLVYSTFVGLYSDVIIGLDMAKHLRNLHGYKRPEKFKTMCVCV